MYTEPRLPETATAFTPRRPRLGGRAGFGRNSLERGGLPSGGVTVVVLVATAWKRLYGERWPGCTDYTVTMERELKQSNINAAPLLPQEAPEFPSTFVFACC